MKKSLFVLALMALVGAPALVSAQFYIPTPLDVDANAIVNVNEAYVSNESGAFANSGSNGAFANSGNVNIRTGNAGAYTYTNNLVNYNDNLIFDDCGCDTPHRRGLDVDANVVVNLNYAEVDNETGAFANTGRNIVADNGGYYYENTTRSSRVHFSGHGNYDRIPHNNFYHYGLRSYYNHMVDYTTGGNVNITTGSAAARTEAVNTVNYNVNRIVRGSSQQ